MASKTKSHLPTQLPMGKRSHVDDTAGWVFASATAAAAAAAVVSSTSSPLLVPTVSKSGSSQTRTVSAHSNGTRVAGGRTRVWGREISVCPSALRPCGAMCRITMRDDNNSIATSAKFSRFRREIVAFRLAAAG